MKESEVENILKKKEEEGKEKETTIERKQD